MPRFQVEVREQWCATYWVDAESEEDARNQVKSCTIGPYDTDFVEVMDEPEDYFVTEIDEDGNPVEPNPDALIILE